MFWGLFELMHVFFDRCRHYGVRVWPEAGTLLGQQRNNNVILWDYDADVGVDWNDRQKLIDIFAKDPRYCLDPDYYNNWGHHNGEKDCFVFHLRQVCSDDDPMIDIVLYRVDEKTNLYRGMLSEEYLNEDGSKAFYRYQPDLLQALHPTVFLGQLSWIPPNAAALLDAGYSPNWRSAPKEFAAVAEGNPYLNSPIRTVETPDLVLESGSSSINKVTKERQLLTVASGNNVFQPDWNGGYFYLASDESFDDMVFVTLQRDLLRRWGTIESAIVLPGNSTVVNAEVAAATAPAVRIARKFVMFFRVVGNGDVDKEQRSRPGNVLALVPPPRVKPTATFGRPVRDFKSLEEAFAAQTKEGCDPYPFVCRKTSEFAHVDCATALDTFRSAPELVWGIVPSRETVEGLHLADLANEWARDRLRVNVVDARVPVVRNLLPPVFDRVNPDGIATHHELTPVLTYQGAYTELHYDPPKKGAGWMHLWAGKKIWHFIHPRYLARLEKKGDEPGEVIDAQPAEVPDVEVWSVVAEGGDTVVFPPLWMHRVWTPEKCLGLGGYIIWDGAKDAQKAAIAIEEEFTRPK